MWAPGGGIVLPLSRVCQCANAGLSLLEPEPAAAWVSFCPFLPHPLRDQLNALRREKQKLVEKIMDQYRVLEPGPLPRTK